LDGSNGRKTPPFLLDSSIFYDDPEFHCAYYWTTNEHPPLQRQVTLKNEGQFIFRDTKDGKVQHVKHAPPYDTGFTNAVAIWSNGTDVSGVLVFRDYAYTEFWPKMKGRSSADLLKTFAFKCTVTNVQSAAIVQIPMPLPDGRVLVTDLRVPGPHGAGATHLTTKGSWHPEAIQADELALEQNTKLQAGQLAPDFTVKTLDDKLLKLSDFRGKYVLLDFWATTCVPCIAQIPDLKATYDSFNKDDRFVMLSLNMDTTEAELKKVVATKGMHWTQGFLDEPVRSSVKHEYGFTAVPQVLLVGPNGRVVATKLRGPNIKEAVAEALGSR
jgi:peroxiredoxin